MNDTLEKRLALASCPVLAVLAGCWVDVDALAGGNPLAGLCQRDEQCDEGLLCSAGACSLPSSCAALKQARPDSPDGSYIVQPDKTGTRPPLQATCDMTRGGGGWLAVTAALLAEGSAAREVTVEQGEDEGGLTITVFANQPGCGEVTPFHSFVLQNVFAWSEIRFRQTFAGKAQCYSILGNEKRIYSQPKPNLIPFELGKDQILAEVHMGHTGDEFDGITDHCTESGKHFWNRKDELPREIEVILRRRSTDVPSGLGTAVSCNDFGPGKTSPTWWRYRDIYIR